MNIEDFTIECNFKLKFGEEGLEIETDSNIDISSEEIKEIERILVKRFFKQLSMPEEFINLFLDGMEKSDISRIIMNGGNKNVRN